MKRPQVQPFTMSVITGLVAAVASGAACEGSNRGPTGPTTPTRPSGPPYTISGVITAYRGGPISGVGVTASECNFFWGIPCTTQTDQQGLYSLSSPGAAPTGLAVGKVGYQTAWKSSVSAQDSTANFTLHPSVTLNPNGDTFAGTISGDEFMAGDDVLFGGLCVRTVCKVSMFTEFVGGSRQFELRLRWTDPTRQLALLISRENDDFFHNQPADRYCCSSELIATVYLSGYFQAVAVAFEQAAGGPPGPTDSQQFELTVRPIP